MKHLEGQDVPNVVWNKIVRFIKRVLKDVLGESRNGAPPCMDIVVEWRDKSWE